MVHSCNGIIQLKSGENAILKKKGRFFKDNLEQKNSDRNGSELSDSR